jgi:hypothetical protein
MSGSWSFQDLPNLDANNHIVTSPSSRRYNCIGWAAGSTSQWWWPVGRSYWPPSAPREETVEAFIRAYATIGYIECENGSLESSFEKIAIYAVQEKGDGALTPTHAAKQLSSGRWTSKLGPFEDIEHTALENVNCQTYGEAVAYLKRPLRDSTI